MVCDVSIFNVYYTQLSFSSADSVKWGFIVKPSIIYTSAGSIIPGNVIKMPRKGALVSYLRVWKQKQKLEKELEKSVMKTTMMGSSEKTTKVWKVVFFV